MHIIDWLIVAAIFIALGIIGYKTKKYVKGISGFLAADRCAGRYLLTLADGMAALGAIGMVATFQQYYEAGFGGFWWGRIFAVVMMFVSISGFVIYRFRQTRAMTMAQFFEMRYSKRFRIFSGILCFGAGVINYGIFPAVTARFLIYFCDIPLWLVNVGPLTINISLGIVMAVLLIAALLITFRGGQIAIMVTDFFQAQYVNVVFLVVLLSLLWQFGIRDVADTLVTASEGKSMVNPFSQGEIENFNVWFFMLMAFNQVYTWKAWQGNQGYNCSAKNPHEAKMAGVLGMWRYGATWTIMALIPIFAYFVMNNPAFSEQADNINAAVSALEESGAEKQLLVPFILKEMLPVGVLGLFVGAFIASAISTDDTNLHSWGSILVQDVIVPLRKEPLDGELRIKWIKRSIIGVAVFVWLWSMFFPLYDFIFMYFAITGAIYVGGGGAVIIGGLYWKKGTTAGAWAAMVFGAVVSILSIIIINVFWPLILPGLKVKHPDVEWLVDLPKDFWFNGMEMFCYTAFCCIGLYVLVSLMTKPKKAFSIDKMLHRGKYAIEGESKVVRHRKKNFLEKLSGVDDEYTGFDKFVAYGIVAWNFFWFAIFLIGTGLSFFMDFTEEQWVRYWIFDMAIWSLVGGITVVWFLWGGFKDLKAMFKTLAEVKVDDHDDGTVFDEQNNETE